MLMNLHPQIHSRQPIPIQKEVQNYVYAPDDQIGVGQFSKVFRGKHKLTGEDVAIKVIDLKSITDPIFLVMIDNEINVLKLISPNHNIIRFYEILNTVNNKYIITEFCNGGDLQHLLKKRGRIQEARALQIFQSLLDAMQELKGKSVIHRDIKPANILFNNDIPKLADFGFSVSKHLQSENQKRLELYNVGTPLYMAPETILKNMYGFKSDMWSLGAVLYEMLFGIVPFYSNSEPELIKKLKDHSAQSQLTFPQDVQISHQTRQIVVGLLEFDIKKRYGVDDCFQVLQQTRRREMSPHKIPQQQIQYQVVSMQKRFNNHSFEDPPNLSKNSPHSHSEQSQHSGVTVHNRLKIYNMVPGYIYNQQQTERNKNKENSVHQTNLSSPNIAQNYYYTGSQMTHSPARQLSQTKLHLSPHSMNLKPANSPQQLLGPSPYQTRKTEPSLQSQEYLVHFVTFVTKVIDLMGQDTLMNSRMRETESVQSKILSLKLTYCLVKDSVIKLSQYQQLTFNQVPQELQILFIRFQQMQQDREGFRVLVEGDQRFAETYNTHLVPTEEFTQSVQFYLRLCLIFLNHYLDVSLSHHPEAGILPEYLCKSIILLDYMVTLQMLIKLSRECGSNTERFSMESKIESISKVKAAELVNKQHFTRVAQKIKRFLI